MHIARTILAALLVGAVAAAVATAREQERGDSAEMKKIFAEDQADRQINMAAMTPQQRDEWFGKIGPRDAARRNQVHELISHGELRTGQDFYEGAMVFQHGDKPDDYLLAHTLAIVAVSKGDTKSRWIAAATLDRYLQKIQQPQIYGTQFFIGPKAGDQWTQDPYNRQLVPDALRKDMCVPDQAQQQKVVEMMRQGKEPQDEPKVPGC